MSDVIRTEHMNADRTIYKVKIVNIMNNKELKTPIKIRLIDLNPNDFQFYQIEENENNIPIRN